MEEKRLRKGQGLPINVIIIAALLLVTLIVVLGIFTGKFGKFSRDVESCTIKGGICRDNCNEINEKAIEGSCTDLTGKTSPNKKCCIKVIE